MLRLTVSGALRHMIAVACSSALAAPVLAQSPFAGAPDSVNLRRIFASGEFGGQGAGGVRWLNGDSYTALERSAGSTDIVKYDAASGKREILVAASRIRSTAGPIEMEDYSFSANGKQLLVFTNSQKVWRDNTRGDYWIIDLASSAVHKLGGAAAKPSTLMFAKFSPAGDRVAYVREGDLYVEPVSGGTPTRLTNDASRTIVNGTSDWVYEEEFGFRDTWRWAPDGKTIAYLQFDMAGVRDYTLINDTDSLYSFTTLIQYPKVGQTNSAVRVGFVQTAGGKTTWVKLAGDSRQMYVPNIEWAGAGSLMIQHMNRLQNRDEVVLANAATGTTQSLFIESDSAWVNVNNDVRWIEGGKRFLWESERDGWRHIYSVSRDGKDVKLVTPGAYDIVAVAGIDETGGNLYFIASPTDATRRYLYRASLTAPGAPSLVSPNVPGTHGYNVSPSAKWALHTMSSFDSPPTVDVVSLPAHQSARTLATNDRLRTAVAPIVSPRPVEFFKVTVASGTTLDGWMLRPSSFDSTKKYPMLVTVYGEPASQTVVDRWGGGGALWHRMLADKGYLVVSFDNHGTPAPRGRAWRKSIYGAIGPLSSQEQAEAVQALARARSYVDGSRVAIWGWSGGGSSTLNAMFRHPDVYQVGMAVAPVPDQRLYDSIYEERYVGLVAEHPEHYDVSSPINFAEGLRGKLLVVHGSGDDNVHYQGTERLVNRLVTLGKPFDLMVYPNRTHCICELSGTTLHVYSLLTRYLTTNLPAGPR
ncbi:MAG: S9 family peptidase [bacterium]